MDNLNNQLQLFETLFFESLDSLLVLDVEKNKFIYFNNQTLKMYGYTNIEFSEITPYDLSVEFTNNLKMENKQEEIILKGWDKFITKHKRKNGEIFEVYVKSKKITFNNKILLLISLTDLKNDEKLLIYNKSIDTNSQNIKLIQKIYKWDKKYNILTKNEKIIKLTRKETIIIALLSKNLNNFISYDEINNFSNNAFPTKESFIGVIKRIRKKTNKEFILTYYSKGYKLNR